MGSSRKIINFLQGIRNLCNYRPMSKTKVIRSKPITRQPYLVTRTFNKSMSVMLVPTRNFKGSYNMQGIMQPALALNQKVRGVPIEEVEEAMLETRR
jgi:hypothetical protein